MEYLTAKQTIGKLRQGKVTDISEAYFSQLVTTGAIPFHTVPGKKRKLYLYDEVKRALANIQDPTRDAQREAVVRKKYLKEKAIKEMDFNLTRKELNVYYLEVIERQKIFEDMTEDKYKKVFNTPRDEWEGETIEECYLLDMEVTKENAIVLELIDCYKEAVESEKPETLEEQDLIIKRVLTHALLSKEFYTLDGI